EADENRLTDQEMPDIELGEFADARHRLDRVEGQPVPGMYFEAEFGAVARRLCEPAEFNGEGRLARLPGFAIASGMQFDDWRAECLGGVELAPVGLDEQRHADARFAELRHHRREALARAGGVEAAFGGALLAPLRHDADGMR